MSRASQATFEIITAKKVLSARREQVYTALWQHEEDREKGLTHNEISKYVAQDYSFPENYRNNTVARLDELEKQGIVERTGELICPLSGYPATTWKTVDRLPEDYVHTEPACFWVVMPVAANGKGGFCFRRKKSAEDKAATIKSVEVEVIQVFPRKTKKKFNPAVKFKMVDSPGLAPRTRPL